MENENQIVAYLATEESFCTLLRQLMEQHQVPAAMLCEGICSTDMMTRMKNGERVPDKMTRDRLLARLGLSDERSENMLDREDYVNWEVRRDIVRR